MTDGAASSAQQLFDGILSGQVPRQVRLFAARGLLPVSREDLYRLQLILSADPDEELAGAAAAALAQEPMEALLTWVREHEVEPVVLDLLGRVRSDELIWAEIARCSAASDQTLRVLARHGPPLVQDIIITNQVRILDCLEILEDLKENPQATPAVLRRVREFEEEFIDKARRQELDPTFGAGSAPSIEKALTALRAIGANIPREGDMPYVGSDDPELEEVASRHEGGTYGRLAQMSVKEKIVCALKGNREERAVLVNSRNRLVVHAVLSSPKLSDSEVERFAQLRSVSEEVIRVISSNRRWLQVYGIKVALTQNPKTPLDRALRLLPSLSARDLARASQDRNIHPVVRKRAAEMRGMRR